MKLFCCFLVLCATCVLSAEGAEKTDEHKLHDFLLDPERYNKHQRPYSENSTVTNVKIGLSLIQIISVDENAQSLYVRAWEKYMWPDPHLAWDPAEWKGVTTLRVPVEQIWTPDVTLLNSASPDEREPVLAVLYHTGDVLWIPSVRLHTLCPLDLTRFPYDTQECLFKLGSWTYDGFQLDTSLYEGKEEIDLSDMRQNAEWEVVGTKAWRYEGYYPCCPEPYPHIRFNITLRRRATYHVFIASPVIIAFLTTLMFVLPAEDTGRFTLGGLLLVCLCSLYALLSWLIHYPASMLGTYYNWLFVLVSLALALCALTTNLARRVTGAPPGAVKSVFLGCLGKLLCVPYDKKYGVGTSDVAMADGNKSDGSGGGGAGAGEWRLLATVLDRIFLIVYLVIIVISTIAVFA